MKLLMMEGAAQKLPFMSTYYVPKQGAQSRYSTVLVHVCINSNTNIYILLTTLSLSLYIYLHMYK